MTFCVWFQYEKQSIKHIFCRSLFFLFSDVTKMQSNRSTSYVCADLFLQFLCASKDLWQVTAAQEDIDEKKQENIHI